MMEKKSKKQEQVPLGTFTKDQWSRILAKSEKLWLGFHQRGINQAGNAGLKLARLLQRIDMSSGENTQLKRILYAYHEAGHAVVWHVVGGLVEEVSIASSQAGYKGYCRFGFLMPNVDEDLSPDEWLQRGRIDPWTVTAYYAGMLAMAYYCASYGGEDDYLDGCEQDDLEKINTLLLRLSSDEQRRLTIKDTCWMEAQKILSDHWPAVQALATKLLKRRILDGKEVHRLIWQTIGYPDADWRFGALNIQQEPIK